MKSLFAYTLNHKYSIASFVSILALVLGFQNCSGNSSSTFSPSATSQSVATLSPVNGTITVNSTQQVTAQNAPPGSLFKLILGAGSIDAHTGLYSAPNADTLAIIGLTDAGGVVINGISPSNITVTGTPVSVQVNPNPASLVTGATLTFSGVGGTAPYTFTETNGTGSATIDSTTGALSAVTLGTVTVTAKDSANFSGSSTVTIVQPLIVSPSPALGVMGQTLSISVGGGQAPYTFSILAGGTGDGSIDSSGNFTPIADGSVTLKIVDSLGNPATAIVNVVTPVQVCASASENSSVTLSCAAGAQIQSIDFASYGTPTGDCATNNLAVGNCNYGNSTAIVSGDCLGKSSCTVAADNNRFNPDPCVNVGKSLTIQATCY